MSDDPIEEVPLLGGRANQGGVVRIGDEVARPAHPQARFVDDFLHHLRDAGVEFAPAPLGYDDRGRQRLTYLPGRAPTSPYPEWAFDRDLLIDVAVHQRRLHAAAIDYRGPEGAEWAVNAGNYFPPGAEGTLFCHNDLCMSNVIVDPERPTVVGLIDFDYVAPTNRLFDIAVVARHWVPFGDPEGAEIPELDRVARFRTIADVHDLDPVERATVIDLAWRFLDQARTNVRALADGGNVGFQQLIAAGYEATNLATLAWIDEHRLALIDA